MAIIDPVRLRSWRTNSMAMTDELAIRVPIRTPNPMRFWS